MLQRLISRYKRLDFRAKLSLALSAICVVMILAAGFSSYRIASTELRKLSARISENNVRTAERGLSEYLNGVQSWTTQILRIQEIRESAKSGESELESSASSTLAFSMAHDVNSAAAEGITFEAIEFYAKSGFSYIYPSNSRTGCGNYEDCMAMLTDYGVHLDSDYSRTQWLVCPLMAQHTGREESYLLCVRFLYDSLMNKQGVLLAAVNTEEFYKTFMDYESERLILNDDGVVFSASNTYQIGELYPDEALRIKILENSDRLSTFSYTNRAGKTVLYSCYPVMDNSAVLAIPFDYYTGISRSEMRDYVISVSILMIVMIAIALILSHQISLWLSRSLKELTNTVKRIDAGELELRCPVEGQDETAYLAEKINNMLDSILASMRLQEQDLQAARLLELKLLQSQINPHLLYNTLNSVLWHLQENRKEDATELVSALSGFFKLSLAKGNYEVPLESEIQLIRYYLAIQYLARQQDIKLSVDIPPELLKRRVIKLSLQPIVENSILHGFAGYRTDGKIDIQAALEPEGLQLTVIDNGIGLMPEELASIRSILAQYPPPEYMKAFGLYNIHWRIRHTYGGNYGLTIESKVSEYTKVTLRFPVLQERRTGDPHDLSLV